MLARSRIAHSFRQAKPSSLVQRTRYPASARVASTVATEFISTLPQAGDVVSLKCERLGFDGKGVCLYGPTKFVVLCERSLPGEELEAKVTSVKKGYAEAAKLRTVKQHDNAAEPLCPHFGPCGGCTLQNLQYEAQLAAKETYVREKIRRVGRIADVESVMLPALGAPSTYHYRNKTTFHFSTTQWSPAAADPASSISTAAGWTLGQLRPGSATEVLPISTCSVQDATADQILQQVQALCQQLRLPAFDSATRAGLLRNLTIRKGSSHGTAQYLAILTTQAAATAAHLMQLTALAQQLSAAVPQLAGVTLLEAKDPPPGRSLLQVVRQRQLWGADHLTERLCGLTFRISPQSFFQVNSQQAEVLYQLVREAAQLQPDDVLLDLYCGTGTIGLTLSRHCKAVVGYEISAAAVEDAKVNAALNGITNASFVLGDIQQVFQDMLQQQQGSSRRRQPSSRGGKRKQPGSPSSSPAVPKPDVVVVDPARAGMSASAVAFVRTAQPRRLVYVSCNAATLARDIEALCRPPGPALRLVSVQAVDMFPHSDHVEVVALLERCA